MVCCICDNLCGYMGVYGVWKVLRYTRMRYGCMDVWMFGGMCIYIYGVWMYVYTCVVYGRICVRV